METASPYVTPAELAPGEIEVFRAGVHPKYPTIRFTPATLDGWMQHARQHGMPKIVLGDHDDFVEAKPIEDLRRVRNSLVARCGTQPRFVADVTRAGLLPDVSIQTTPDARGLDHIAFLWRATPGVAGMLPTHLTFTTQTPPPMPHPAYRFDSGDGEDCMGGGYDALCAESPEAVVVVPSPPPPVDVAGEIAGEDRQSFVDRVFSKVFDIAQRFRGAPTLSPEEQFQRAATAMQQGAALVSASPAEAEGGAGGSAQFTAGEDDMKPEEMTAAIQAALSPVTEKLQALEGQVLAFSAQQTAAAAAAQQELAQTRAARSLSFSQALVAQGAVETVPQAEVFGALHLALQGQTVRFGQGDDAKEYDGAEMLEAALHLRDPRLQFGRLVLDPGTKATPQPQLSIVQEAAMVRAIQDKYAAAGTPISTADANLRFSNGERA